MQSIDQLIGEMEDLPDPMLGEVLQFVRFLKSQMGQERMETVLLSETALKKDWLLPEEEKAWQDL